jgi:hypothetical protein
MDVQIFLNQLQIEKKQPSFADTMEVVEVNYNFSPTAFQNGSLMNAAGENSGSCKLFSFAKMHDLSVLDTLTCFGSYYFEDVLGDPDGVSHQNIRNFMKTGWDGIRFDSVALVLK